MMRTILRKTNSNFLRSKRLVIFELMRTEFSRRMLILFLYSQCCLSGQNCQLTPERGDWRENHLRSYLQLISFKGDWGMKFFLRIMMRTILRKTNSNFCEAKGSWILSWWDWVFCAERWFCFCIASVVFWDRIANWLLKGGIGVRITWEVIYNWSVSEVTDEWGFFPRGKEEKGKTAEDWVKRLANFCVAEDCEYWVDETEFSHRTLILSSV